ncbi:MAG: arylsulfatase, partial [Eudoraea sp.]
MKTKKLLSILFTCLFIIGIAIPMQAQQSSQPNVVLMLSDNMGYGDLGIYGSGGELRGMPT